MIGTSGLRRVREGIRRGRAHPSLSWLSDHDAEHLGGHLGGHGPEHPDEGHSRDQSRDDSRDQSRDQSRDRSRDDSRDHVGGDAGDRSGDHAEGRSAGRSTGGIPGGGSGAADHPADHPTDHPTDHRTVHPTDHHHSRRPHAAPWSSVAVREVRLVAAGLPFLLPLLILVTLTKLTATVIVLLLLSVSALTQAQRSRFRSLGELEIPAHPPLTPPGTPAPSRLLAWLGAESTWRQVGYHVLIGPTLALFGLFSLLAFGAGGVMSTVFAWHALMPRGSLIRGSAGTSVLDVLITAAGVTLLFAGPWLAVRVARIDRRAAWGLLGPSRARELQRRVEDLAESRAGVVDAADAERRRIERDLHDGAQQRLVSLAMNLGLARKTLKDVSPEAMRVIVEAHEEAQAAIAELRDLVRGLHPVVLEDRGLDAALSGIAARAPLPVRLDVSLPGRVAPTVEAVAYFVVSEALANVAKHARASRADLSVRRLGPLLRIVIADNGVGGADAARGTGLTGLRKRAASVDGTLAISSPIGGPTVITVELPCEL
ncbi:sensor histidine kinase [Kitasatospora sp. NBC_01287]|uniref:sensor histidine kinase n=1 Tax=Kitasatospora sp. NBC_01287 TaxID=2903573 RepID=UPI00224E6734|nr:sensor histidine kinase [Kitasatospora sp. NBC_01287]MCX4749106.1 sensor histidine kinase [Kitasatospora sp. NBC_01287]